MRALLLAVLVGLALLPGEARAEPFVVGDYFKLMMVRCLINDASDVRAPGEVDEVSFRVRDADFLLSQDAYWPHFDGTVFAAAAALPALGVREPRERTETWGHDTALGVGCYYLAAHELHP